MKGNSSGDFCVKAIPVASLKLGRQNETFFLGAVRELGGEGLEPDALRDKAVQPTPACGSLRFLCDTPFLWEGGRPPGCTPQCHSS